MLQSDFGEGAEKTSRRLASRRGSPRRELLEIWVSHLFALTIASRFLPLQVKPLQFILNREIGI
jgi:hypothetical protein